MLTDRRKLKYHKKSLAQYHYVHHKFHVNYMILDDFLGNVTMGQVFPLVWFLSISIHKCFTLIILRRLLTDGQAGKEGEPSQSHSAVAESACTGNSFSIHQF
jgi:hypothetical protein